MLKRPARSAKNSALEANQYALTATTATLQEEAKAKRYGSLENWRQSSSGQWAVVIMLTVLAFIMRRAGLATQSLWFDEADLLDRASRDLNTIFGSFLKAGENGPLYTLFVHFWTAAFGTGEAALRTPSLLAGTAAIPLLYLVGRRLCNGSVGLVAAFLLAISPYNIWYSQDAKMYPLALAFSLASIWLFLKALASGRRRWWALYLIITTLSFYIHVMAALIVGVQLVYYWWQRDKLNKLDRKVRRRMLIALGLLTLPYLPIALWQARALWDGTVGQTWFVPVGLLDMVNILGRRFGINRSIEPWETFGALVFAVLAIFGLMIVWLSRSYKKVRLSESQSRDNGQWSVAGGQQESQSPPTGQPFGSKSKVQSRELELNPQSPVLSLQSSNSHRPNSAAFLTVYLFVPVLSFYVLTTRIPLFADRYLLVASPAYYLLVAVGLVWLARRFWPIAALALTLGLVMVAIALSTYNYSKEAQKEDWREAMRLLSEQVRTGDQLFVLPGYVESVVRYYFKPAIPIPIVTIPQDLLDGRDDTNLNAFIQNSIKGYERVWLVVSPERYLLPNNDPDEYVRKVWFDNNTRLFRDPLEVVGVKLYAYSFIKQPGTDSDFYPRTSRTNYIFGDTLEFFGYDYRQSAAGAGVNLPQDKVVQGDYLHLTLHWRFIKPDPGSYAMMVRLVDKDGNDMATNYAAQPLGGYFPTTKWRVGEAWRDYRDIFIKVPPGQYFVEITVYPVDKPQNLLVVRGDENGQTGQADQKVRLAIPVTVLPKK